MNTFGRIDILINNAGVGNYKNFVDTSADDYDEMMDSNVRSTFLFTRHAVPVMVKQGEGLVLVICPMAGLYGFADEVEYCTTKFAQIGFAQALDKELRPHGIKVGTICPGGVKTEFAIGKGRTEEEVERSDILGLPLSTGPAFLRSSRSLTCLCVSGGRYSSAIWIVLSVILVVIAPSALERFPEMGDE